MNCVYCIATCTFNLLFLSRSLFHSFRSDPLRCLCVYVCVWVFCLRRNWMKVNVFAARIYFIISNVIFLVWKRRELSVGRSTAQLSSTQLNSIQLNWFKPTTPMLRWSCNAKLCKYVCAQCGIYRWVHFQLTSHIQRASACIRFSDMFGENSHL